LPVRRCSGGIAESVAQWLWFQSTIRAIGRIRWQKASRQPVNFVGQSRDAPIAAVAIGDGYRVGSRLVNGKASPGAAINPLIGGKRARIQDAASARGLLSFCCLYSSFSLLFRMIF
jgi:hypothetical protein